MIIQMVAGRRPHCYKPSWLPPFLKRHSGNVNPWPLALLPGPPTHCILPIHDTTSFLIVLFPALHTQMANPQDHHTTVVPRITSTPFYNEIALRWRFCNRKTMFPMGEFCFAMIGSLLWEPILAKGWFLASWSVVSKWPPEINHGRPLFSGMDSSLNRQQKWPHYGGSLLNGEFEAPRNALIAF